MAFESFAYQKMGYHDAYELGPAEVVKITERGWETLLPAEKEMKVCAFLWTYYGYPNSNYEGVNVEVMRNRNGVSLAKTDREKGVAQDIDYVSGVPDSGTPHAIGYANESGIPFARPFIKYTPTWPRSFMPTNQKERDRVAKMKQIPVHDLIEGKSCSLWMTASCGEPSSGRRWSFSTPMAPRRFISARPVLPLCMDVSS